MQNCEYWLNSVSLCLTFLESEASGKNHGHDVTGLYIATAVLWQ